MKAILGIGIFVLAIWLALCLAVDVGSAYGWQSTYGWGNDYRPNSYWQAWYPVWGNYYVPATYWFRSEDRFYQNVYDTRRGLGYLTRGW